MSGEVVVGIAGLLTTALAALGTPVLSSRRTRADQLVDARKAGYEACLVKWRQVEAHVRNPDFAEFMAYGERLGDLWVLASQVSLYGSAEASALSKDVTAKLIDWAMWFGAPRKSVNASVHAFPEAQIAAFEAQARSDLQVK